jgi:hypothetical protein
MYGHALAAMVPQLAWCDRFELQAKCVLAPGDGTLELRRGDPIFPAEEPRRYDSKLEERFARDFTRAAPRWRLIREPHPVQAGTRLIYPDFLLVHREDAERSWTLEIVGFWTADYLRTKLGAYRRARLPRLILCVDQERQCSEEDFPSHARVVRYRRRIRPEDVLEAIASASA